MLVEPKRLSNFGQLLMLGPLWEAFQGKRCKPFRAKMGISRRGLVCSQIKWAGYRLDTAGPAGLGTHTVTDSV